MKPANVIWLAIVFSTFIYAGIIWFIAGNPEGTFQERLQDVRVQLLYLIALATFVAANFLPRTIKAPAQTKLVVTLALFEACAIYGLVAAFLTHDWRVFVPAWVLALIGMWMARPTAEPAVTHV